MGRLVYIVICDDDPDYREILGAKIQGCLQNRFCMECSLTYLADLESLQAHLRDNRVDALFLDVLLEEENAMDWSIAHLAAQSTPIIFMTSFPEAAYNISETNCCYYLVKSHIDEVSLTRALQAALRKAAGHDANMTVIRQGSLNRVVNYADVLYIETFNNNLTLHLTDGGRVSVYSSLKDFAERLPPNFLRCHKSYMVNMNHVASFTPHLFTLRSGGTVPIPPKKYKQIVAQYRAYLENLR